MDNDGTLLRTDMLLECAWKRVGNDPAGTLRALGRLPDKAAFKAKLARVAPLRTDLLPTRDEVVALVETARAAGREVVLASASDATLVEPLAQRFGFDRVFASRDGANLKVDAKARALVAAFGERCLDYAGDAAADMAVWRHADHAIVVGRPAGGPDSSSSRFS